MSVLASELSGMQLDTVTLNASGDRRERDVQGARLRHPGRARTDALGVERDSWSSPRPASWSPVRSSPRSSCSRPRVSAAWPSSCSSSRRFCIAQYLPKALTRDLDQGGRARAGAGDLGRRRRARRQRVHDQGQLRVSDGGIPRHGPGVPDGGLPFQPIRNTVYTADELFAGYQPSVAGSYGTTMDFRSYQWFVKTGRSTPIDPYAAMMRALHDSSVTLRCRRGDRRPPRGRDHGRPSAAARLGRLPQHRRTRPRPRPPRHARLHRGRPGRDGGRAPRGGPVAASAIAELDERDLGARGRCPRCRR